jgi:hypothetical protein
MRVRKGMLALQDFQKQLNHAESISVLKCAIGSSHIHPVIRDALSVCAGLLAVANVSLSLSARIADKTGFFNKVSAESDTKDIRIAMVNPRRLFTA